MQRSIWNGYGNSIDRRRAFEANPVLGSWAWKNGGGERRVDQIPTILGDSTRPIRAMQMNERMNNSEWRMLPGPKKMARHV